jgi:hypothetical protein
MVIAKNPMRNLIILLPSLLTTSSSSVFGWNGGTEASPEDEEIDPGTCTDDGVCFSSFRAKEEYYFKGTKVPINFGEDQTVAGKEWAKTLEVIKKTKEYMNEVAVDNKYKEVRDECLLRHDVCSFWAGIGECQANPSYMATNCAPSCQSWYVYLDHR